jgi:hypothetical protein
MTREVPDYHPLHRLFRGLTEHTFATELGIADPRLVGYVASLLVRFVPSDASWRLRDKQGRRLTEVAAMIAEAEATPDEDRRHDYHRHVGDFTLFWSGVYPEALDQFRAKSSPDHLIDFQQQGKRSYYLASTFARDEQAPVLRRLSDEFELCAFGLSLVRKEWEHLEGETSRLRGGTIQGT